MVITRRLHSVVTAICTVSDLTASILNMLKDGRRSWQSWRPYDDLWWCYGASWPTPLPPQRPSDDPWTFSRIFAGRHGRRKVSAWCDGGIKARLHQTATLWRHRRCHGGLQNIRGRRRTAMNLIFDYFFVNDTVFGRHSGGITAVTRPHQCGGVARQPTLLR